MQELFITFTIVAFLTSGCTNTEPATAKRGNDPVIVETYWGQKVVPDLPTYMDMIVYSSLEPGQSWSDGDSIKEALKVAYDNGTLKLRRHPWRVMDDIFVLGQDEESQLIYLIDTGEGLLLIDPSYDSWHEEILSQIKGLGYSPSQVKWVLITHCHVDHAQSCHLWRKKGAQIIAPLYDAHSIETGNQVTAFWLMEEDEEFFTGCPVDRVVHDGDRLDFGRMTFYAIWTPGHTPGSTCYLLKYMNKQLLFSEDIALHNGRYAWMEDPYADWDQYLKSLKKLENFHLNGEPVQYDLLLPGHGVVELEGAMRSVKETTKLVSYIKEHHRERDWIKPYQWNWENKVIYNE